MNVYSPRARALLRQAKKTESVGKRKAASELYQQIVDEEPEVVEAWLGLARLSQDSAAERAAYERALELDPRNVEALEALGRPVPAPEPEPVLETELARTPRAQLAPPDEQVHEHEEEDLAVVCYRHPDRKTSLRCYNCDRPICIKCANPTPVGYICPICKYEAEEAFYSATLVDYAIAGVVALILGLIGGYIARFIGFFVIFVAAGGGALIGRLAFRAARRRRGRYLPQMVATMVAIGGILPNLVFLLALLSGNFSFTLVWIGIYIFLAPSAAFWQVK